ncbi:MAG: APC family permease, partial [Actinobacteria bacterium]|nr:APC family permease [Actinomycetota bacterium]
LGLAGTAALGKVVPISIAVALLLATVVTSYRQTVRAYPTGGGAYRVARDNLGKYAGLLAASALLIDYVMTVAVSITSGVDAIISAVPDLRSVKIAMAFLFILFVTLANLRGVRESGTLFAIPTYGFVLSIYLLLATGFVKCLGGCPPAESATQPLEAETALTVFVILKAFSAGTTALTGVEAIADGVQAFRYPQSRNAASTLSIMGVFAISMFLGISWLADHTNVVFTEGAERTVLAQVGHAIFGGGPAFYILQVMTASILILAANTAFQDFPRLSSILAQDRVMPRQFMNRGDRLVFSNGVLILAAIAAALIYLFDANLTRLIQLYLVGVFISFTLSQSGMVLRWRRLRERGWKQKAVVNGFGAFVTGAVLLVTVRTKFAGGAWIVIVAIPIVMYAMRSVERHYTEVGAQLRDQSRKPTDRRRGNQHLVILVDEINVATARAVGYARSVGTGDVEAVAFDESHSLKWNEFASDIPLRVLTDHGSQTAALKAHLRSKRKALTPNDFLTVIVPELLQSRGLLHALRHPGYIRLKAALVAEPDVQVLDLPVPKDDSGPLDAQEPLRNHVLVLVSGVHNATLQAIEYAETLEATDLRAVSFSFDAESSERLGDQWLEYGIPLPLEIEDSPFRDIGTSLLHYIRPFKPDGVHRVVTIVMPEFLVRKKRHRVLHNQTGLVVKSRMLTEPGVVVVSVPYHL